MSEKQFANGANVKSITTRYGEIIKVGINKEKFMENPDNDGWVNFDIKKGQNGNYYAELNTYKG